MFMATDKNGEKHFFKTRSDAEIIDGGITKTTNLYMLMMRLSGKVKE